MTESPQTNFAGPGGFLPPQTSLPSPAPSTASSRVAALLPRPRSKPLVPGSRKEDYARDYVARRLLHISRRYVKKFGIPDPADQVHGYESMEEVCRDLDEVVDVLWFSGTPSLQIPYLLNIALAFNTYLPSFPPAPRPTFALLRKLDHCFASLLVGYDIKTKKPLPGFTSSVDGSTQINRFSGTDRVRCKSLADETRMLVAVVMSGENDVVDYDEDDFEEIKRPARARSEPRDEPSGHATAKQLDFRQEQREEDDNVKMNGMDDVEELDFSSDDEDNKMFESNDSSSSSSILPSSTKKRKAAEITKDVTMTDQQTPATTSTKTATSQEEEHAHRVKIEDDRDPIAYLRGMPSVSASPVPTSSPAVGASSSKSEGDKGKGQRHFHFALDDDDEDDDDDSTSQIKPKPDESTSVPIAAEPVRRFPAPDDDAEPKEEEEDIGYGEEGEVDDDVDEEEEEEEMHMNVARVYEKTLVHLGQTLGESITDD